MSSWRQILAAVGNNVTFKVLGRTDTEDLFYGSSSMYISPSSTNLVAFVNNDPAGYQGWGSRGGRPIQITYTALYIRPKYRHRGIGKMLQEGMISYLNGKYGIGNYVIDSQATTEGGEALLRYRKTLMFNPKHQVYEPFNSIELLDAGSKAACKRIVNYLNENGINAYPDDYDTIYVDKKDYKQARALLKASHFSENLKKYEENDENEL